MTYQKPRAHMKHFTRTTQILLLATLASAAALPTFAQGCCADRGAIEGGCPMGKVKSIQGCEGHAATGAATAKAVFPKPVQSAFDSYIKVQEALAKDSLEGVSSAAASIAKAVQGDSMRMLPLSASRQAEALASAKSLDEARAAFKTLSESLIQVVKDQKPAVGVYHVAYCPMAKASWFQTGSTVVNPYMGKSMVHCGQFKT